MQASSNASTRAEAKAEVADEVKAVVTVEATATADTGVATLDAMSTTRAVTTMSVVSNKRGSMIADTTTMVATESRTIGRSFPIRARLMLTKQAQTTGQRWTRRRPIRNSCVRTGANLTEQSRPEAHLNCDQ